VCRRRRSGLHARHRRRRGKRKRKPSRTTGYMMRASARAPAKSKLIPTANQTSCRSSRDAPADKRMRLSEL
jgi:hypothetical protein